jgi:hypothetical protein
MDTSATYARAAESLTEEESVKLHAAMRAADPSGGLEKCLQGKEMLRGLLAWPGPTRTGA